MAKTVNALNVKQEVFLPRNFNVKSVQIKIV